MAYKAANLRLFAVPLAAALLPPSASFADDQQDKIFATSQRLRKGFKFAELKAGKPRVDKVECYRPKEHYGRFGRDGYPVARVVSVEIDAGKDAVMAAWMDAERRQGWDPNVHRIVVRPSPDGPVTQTYARSPLPYLVPARDYCTRTYHSSGALIGVDDFTASALVHVDAYDACPASWLSVYVRGRLNAILLLQPLAPARTRATYVVESDPGGWGFLAPAVANVFHGDAAALTLAGLKRAAERVDAGDEDGLTVEQVCVCVAIAGAAAVRCYRYHAHSGAFFCRWRGGGSRSGSRTRSGSGGGRPSWRSVGLVTNDVTFSSHHVSHGRPLSFPSRRGRTPGRPGRTCKPRWPCWRPS